MQDVLTPIQKARKVAHSMSVVIMISLLAIWLGNMLMDNPPVQIITLFENRFFFLIAYILLRIFLFATKNKA